LINIFYKFPVIEKVKVGREEKMNRRKFLKTVGTGVAYTTCPPLFYRGHETSSRKDEKPPNILFIAVDDMADWCGCLGGHPDVKTPNIDKLAKRGILFTNAHCVSPICGPSRAAVLTGKRPETTGIYTNKGTYIDYVPGEVSIPRYFKRNGYHVMGTGKINHGLGMRVAEDWHEYGPDCGIVGTPFTDEELSSSSMMDSPKVINRGKLKCTLPMNGGLSMIDRPENQWDTFDWGPLDLDDEDFPDGKIANWSVEQLNKQHEKPFFLATGFYKPHQPFFVPRKYFDMYDPEKITLPPTIAGDLNDVPKPGRDLALRPWTSGTHKTVTKHNQWREAVTAYLATITFADAQIGKVIDAFDQSSFRENTWIILWSDHGWSLGEKEHWGKHDPWSGSLKSPLIIIPPKNHLPPGFKPGIHCHAPVSLLDIYPTLLEICGFPVSNDLEGQTLLPLVKNPNQKWNEAVVASIGRGSHSVFTKKYRYIHYFDSSEELYDHEVDPEEWFNLASDRKYRSIKKELMKHIPIDKNYRQFVRWGRWKCLIKSDGSIMLFDIHESFGISEQNNIAAENPEIIKLILTHLDKNKIKDRYVTIEVNQ